MLNGAPQSSDNPPPDLAKAAPAPQRPVKIKVLVSPHGRRETPNPSSLPPLTRINVLVSNRRRSSKQIQRPEPADQPDWPDWVEDDQNEPDDDPVQVWVAPKEYSLLKGLASVVAWVGFWVAIAVGVGGSGWLGMRLILNPGSVTWLQWMMPDWNRTPLVSSDTALTLNEVRADLGTVGLVLGKPMLLPQSAGQSTPDWLFPVFAQRPSCTGDSTQCQQIVELRVYHPSQTPRAEPAFRLIDRLAVAGPQEFFVVAPLVETVVDSQGSARALPLTDVSLLNGQAPKDGIWLTLSGQWRKGSTAIAYGQLLRYDPTDARLWASEEWTSPTQTLPTWSQVTAGGMPELIVDQTVGLEPDYRVYQLVSHPTDEPPITLEPISLQQPALTYSSYKNALTLAQHGLWSPALDTLSILKNQNQGNPSRWSGAAQRQMDVIALHAKATSAQAKRNWASPSQRILAQIIDGQLATALRSLETALKQGVDLNLLLRDNSGQIWQRVTAMLRVHPKQADAQAWGTLVMAVRGDRTTAITWLQQRLEQTGITLTLTTPLDERTQRLLNLLDQVPVAQTATAHPSQIVGTALPLATVRASDWLGLEPTRQLAAGQRWYRVQIDRFFDGQRWQRSPFRLEISPLDQQHQLWQRLGLMPNDSIQLLTWAADGSSHTASASVHAVQWQNGRLDLLVMGDAQSTGAALATSDGALRWQQPQGLLTVADLTLQTPVTLQTLWQTLYPNTAIPVDPTALQSLASLSVEPLVVRGGNHREYRLTLTTPTSAYTEASSASPPAIAPDAVPPRTLILSEQGSVLLDVSTLGANATVRGVASVGDSAPHLVIETGNAYRLLTWSDHTQRFE